MCNEKAQSIIKALYVIAIAIAIAKVVTKCSIIITNPNCSRTCQISAIRNIKSTRGDNKRRKTTKKKKKKRRRGTTSSSTKPRNKGLISKTTGSTNAGKKALTTTLQVYHLLPHSLNACINGINSRLNPPHEEGSGNLTKMV